MIGTIISANAISIHCDSIAPRPAQINSPNHSMSNSENQSPSKQREISALSEEEDFWDLDDDSADEPISDISDTSPTPQPSIIDTAPAASDPEVVTPPVSDHLAENTFEDIESTVQNLDTSEEIAAPQVEESTEEPESQQNTNAPKKDKLSLIEKVSLTLVAASLLGLAVYGYIWLYKKNLTEENNNVQLPVKGEHMTINAFSTYWKAASGDEVTKMGAKVLPSASITLNSDASPSGALRIFFYNTQNERIGDPVTLPISNGKFTSENKSNITITDDGATIEVVSSDGFHQEGDFSAYVLDQKLAWQVHVSEADTPTASGDDFKEIIKTKVEPKRK